MTVNYDLLLKDIKRIPGMLIAFVIIAYGIVQMKNVNIGMSSWETLHLGIHFKTGIDYGKATQLIGLVIIVFSVFLKIHPGIGTIMNMYFIGLFVDVIDKYNVVIIPENIILKIIVLFWGNIVFCYGVYSYLKFEMGAGPRDGLLVGLVKITGTSVKYIKTILEITVLIIGFLLGGTIGIGTFVVTFSGGYILNEIFKRNNFDPHKTNQRKFSDYIVINEQKI